MKGAQALTVFQFAACIVCALLFSCVSSFEVYYSGSFTGVGSILILVLDFMAFFEILEGYSCSIFEKILWVLTILFFPVLGLLAYFFFGRHSVQFDKDCNACVSDCDACTTEECKTQNCPVEASQ
eukprot:TRINITY_DN3450_c0_g1_i1.p1 TRINITY_DN3450_c0_g1~~TRINITY_DN3450_c0_g1_i1.p1  ORF type:complete len:125 (-),score=16.46 TRINITY_DN3450_c0_g1_i1:113-487(-)